MPITIETANAKLTRTLRIVGRRKDGYHLLDSEMVSIDLADTLEIDEGDGLEIQSEVAYVGEQADVDPVAEISLDASNLVCRALALAGLSRHVRLTKRIPPGAGLGGGSSDAAAVLRYAGVLDVDQAVSLGADVPFCLKGGRARVRGVGEMIEPLDFEEHSFVLITPDFGVSTVAVYRAYDDLAEHGRQTNGENDLEPAALFVEPRLVAYRDLVRDATGITPVLAGSGSTFFVECDAADAASIRALIEQAVKATRFRAALSYAKTTKPHDTR